MTMGKKIIIKGADFSENAIQREVIQMLAIDCDSDIELATTRGTIASSPFADSRYANLYNKHLIGVELKPSKVGSITIVSLYDGVLTDVATINITNDIVGVKTYFNVDVDVREDEIIGIGRSTDTGNFYYNDGESAGFIVRLGLNNPSSVNYGLAVNWYVEELL